MQEEIIIGKNAVIEALHAGRSMNKILLSDQLQGKTAFKIRKLAKESGIITQDVPKTKLDGLTEAAHQGIIAYVAAYQYYDVEDLLDIAKEKNEEPFLIILDELEDPHNLGSILRTADATGVHGVIIPKRRSVGLTATVAKTSAGAIEHVPVARVTNIAQTIDMLKERHVWIVGTDAVGKEDYRQLDGGLPLGIVIGNEGKGMSKLVKKKCDWLVQLPMIGSVSSLNASVACSLLLYEVYRKRFPVGGA